MADVAEARTDSPSPSPDWFTRECLSSGIDPAEFDKIQEIPEPPPLRTRQARALDALGHHAKAVRLDHCEQEAFVAYCKDSHPNRRVICCGERGCTKCAERISRRFIEKYLPSAECIASHATHDPATCKAPYRFTYIELFIRGTWNTETIRAEMEHSSRVMNRLNPDATRTRWIYLAGFTDSAEMVIRILSVDNGHAGQQAYIFEWPTASVQVRILPVMRAPEYLKKLFAPCLPKTPQARAEMEVALTGVRCLRTQNLYPQLKESELLVEDFDSTTDNYEPESPDETEMVKGHTHRCRVCHGPIVEVTERYNIFKQSGEIHKLKRYPLHT